MMTDCRDGHRNNNGILSGYIMPIPTFLEHNGELVRKRSKAQIMSEVQLGVIDLYLLMTSQDLLHRIYPNASVLRVVSPHKWLLYE